MIPNNAILQYIKAYVFARLNLKGFRFKGESWEQLGMWQLMGRLGVKYEYGN